MISRNRSTGRAGVRGLSFTVVALLALTMIGAGSASAKINKAFTMPSTNPTVQRYWTTGAAPGSTLVGTKAVTMSLASEKLTYESTLSGTPVKWTASGLECLNCKIENRAGTGENIGKTEATFSGELKLTGLKWAQPDGCVMPSTLTTKALTGVVGGELGSSTKTTLRLAPTTAGTTWATYELTGSCPNAGLYKWTGDGYGEFFNPLGVAAKTQKLKLSRAIQENLERPETPYYEPPLNSGANEVFFTGEINMNAEGEFGVGGSSPVNEVASGPFTTPSTNPTIPRNWYTGAQPGAKLVGAQTTLMSLASEKLTFSTTIGGEAFKFTASGVECPNCKIENRTGTGENKSNTEAVFSGELTLTGVNLLEHTNCSLPSTLKTQPMTGVIGGAKGNANVAALRLGPTAGVGTRWVTVELLGGEKCPDAGLYKITGNEFGEFANSLGVDAKSQPFRLSPTIQEILGTSSALKFGANPLLVSGEINMASAVEYQLKEK